jgi:hypothetical protein
MLQPILFYSGDTKHLIKDEEVSAKEQKKRECNELMYKFDTKIGLKKEGKIYEQLKQVVNSYAFGTCRAVQFSAQDRGYPETPSLSRFYSSWLFPK